MSSAVVTVRYWAGARQAAGCAEEQATADTLADLLQTLGTSHGAQLQRVLSICSFLVDEQPVGTKPPSEVALPDGAVVDVLPPFAGG